MSGRGKGGKGLGKGGAKRHRKVLRDNIQGAHNLSVLLRVLTYAHPDLTDTCPRWPLRPVARAHLNDTCVCRLVRTREVVSSALFTLCGVPVLCALLVENGSVF